VWVRVRVRVSRARRRWAVLVSWEPGKPPPFIFLAHSEAGKAPPFNSLHSCRWRVRYFLLVRNKQSALALLSSLCVSTYTCANSCTCAQCLHALSLHAHINTRTRTYARTHAPAHTHTPSPLPSHRRRRHRASSTCCASSSPRCRATWPLAGGGSWPRSGRACSTGWRNAGGAGGGRERGGAQPSFGLKLGWA